MRFTKEQYESAMQGYFGPDEEISNEVVSLVKVRKEHECMGVDPDGDCEIKPGDFAICEKAIHADSGRVSCYVCLPCADKWVEEVADTEKMNLTEKLLEQAEEWLNENCSPRLIKQYDRSRLVDFAISLLQWRDVADGLPEVRGIYVVIGEYSLSPYLLEYPYDLSNKWEKTVAAYIPYPIPPYKEQR